MVACSAILATKEVLPPAIASAWIVLGTGISVMRVNCKVRPVLVWKKPWDVQAGRPRGDATGRHQYSPPWLPGGGDVSSDHTQGRWMTEVSHLSEHL